MRYFALILLLLFIGITQAQEETALDLASYPPCDFGYCQSYMIDHWKLLHYFSKTVISSLMNVPASLASSDVQLCTQSSHQKSYEILEATKINFTLRSNDIKDANKLECKIYLQLEIIVHQRR